MLGEFGGRLAVPHGEVEGVALDGEFRRDLVVPLRAIGNERRNDLHRFVGIVLGDIHQRVGAGAGVPNECQVCGAGRARRRSKRGCKRGCRRQKTRAHCLVHEFLHWVKRGDRPCIGHLPPLQNHMQQR